MLQHGDEQILTVTGFSRNCSPRKMIIVYPGV